jgi:acyl-coenzyme A synthetase/AMP-(fatty) acid ligase
LVPHSRVINYIEWARGFFAITDNEVIGNQAPFYFTVSVMDIYLSLATGSKLCVITESLFSKPDKLLEYVDEKKISLIFWVSSVYHHIAQSCALDRVRPAPLKRAWFVGEPMAAQSLHYWKEHLPDAEFANLYGSTETDMTICYRVPDGFSAVDSVPLGQPCAYSEVLLFDDEFNLVEEPGRLGEICVRGPCLALGYYNDAEKTQASFIQNPLHNDSRDLVYRTGDLGEYRDGLIFFRGRKDHQFKHLGYRIEAGEIEAIAMGFSGVRNACVVYDGDKRQIVLFYEAGGDIDERGYRRALMADLPVYMVPTRFVRLDAMPFNANNKKDRILLKKQYIEGGC